MTPEVVAVSRGPFPAPRASRASSPAAGRGLSFERRVAKRLASAAPSGRVFLNPWISSSEGFRRPDIVVELPALRRRQRPTAWQAAVVRAGRRSVVGLPGPSGPPRILVLECKLSAKPAAYEEAWRQLDEYAALVKSLYGRLPVIPLAVFAAARPGMPPPAMCSIDDLLHATEVGDVLLPL